MTKGITLRPNNIYRLVDAATVELGECADNSRLDDQMADSSTLDDQKADNSSLDDQKALESFINVYYCFNKNVGCVSWVGDTYL